MLIAVTVTIFAIRFQSSVYNSAGSNVVIMDSRKSSKHLCTSRADQVERNLRCDDLQVSDSATSGSTPLARHQPC